MIQILLERAGEDYIHNTSQENLVKILDSGFLKGAVQKDGSTKNTGKIPELSVARSDSIPQKSGVIPFSMDGELVKIQLKPAVFNNFKKYPVNYSWFKNNRDTVRVFENAMGIYAPDVSETVKKFCRDQEVRSPAAKKICQEIVNNLKNFTRYQNNYTGKAFNSRDLKNRIDRIVALEANFSGKSIQQEKKRLDVLYDLFPNLEYGEERILTKNGVPVSPKYMTIFLPQEVKSNKSVQDAIKRFLDKGIDIKTGQYTSKTEKIKFQDLFSYYKDTTSKAIERLYNLPDAKL